MAETRDPEALRLAECLDRTRHWKRWGPYLSERAWGTVREDYSADGSAWEYLPHDHSRSRAYRWNEDGLAGICDRHQRICFAIALWNHRDPILKERPFGLTGSEGNHGEDVKEYYYFLDSTPTHSYMKCVYKYPQCEYPYSDLVRTNQNRGKSAPEYELLDTGAFEEDRYFDVFVEYAKAGVDDILIRITIANRGLETAELTLLPTVWFRNTWSWGHNVPRPELSRGRIDTGASVIELSEPYYGERRLYCQGNPALLFTENETNSERLFGYANRTPYVKDGINDCVVNGNWEAVNPTGKGTKAAAQYQLKLAPGSETVLRLRLTDRSWHNGAEAFAGFDEAVSERMSDADAFYANIIPDSLSPAAKNVMRQALAGMLWSKQYYHYVLHDWLRGDPNQPAPPEHRWQGRNHEWLHVYSSDVLSMPDTWEYPWFAAWDLAFHCIPLCMVDTQFAKDQLRLLLREWYMHPNGQLPAYEWAFGDVNPPVHAWSAWRVYKIDQKLRGAPDKVFLECVFHKLIINFTWWVNRKDVNGMNVFQGGFLGLDNIGAFDRSAPLPTGGYLEQSDGTSWMAMYTLNLMSIALELADGNPSYEDVASKFWEHFLYIAHAMSGHSGKGVDLWDDESGFFYDVIHFPDGQRIPMKVRSLVGVIPMFAVETIESDLLDKLPGFKRRLEWFIDNRPDLTGNVACMRTLGQNERRLLSIMSPDQLVSVLRYVLDEKEFLSPYGIRSVSAYHREHPFEFEFGNEKFRVDYEPAESTTGMFGGNSNWRGPIWFPLNHLIIESLQKYHYYYGDDFKVECPTGSGKFMHLWDVAAELSHRLTRIFLPDETGYRAVFGDVEKFQRDPHCKDLLQFFEYFHGDTGKGLGASHQTGWTGLAAKLLQQNGE